MFIFFFVFVLSGACAEDVWQFYRINAQYRGAVKKSFSNIGCSLAWFKDVSPQQTQVIAHVCVENPEKRKDLFAFRTNLIMDHVGNSIDLRNEVYAEFEGVNGERCLEVKQLVCLWDHIRRNLVNPQQLNGLLNVAGQPLNLKTIQKGNQWEVNCSSANKKRFSGKFFIEKTAESLNRIDKFRFRSGKVSVSMVQDNAESVSRDFRSRQPFARIVFDNK